MALDGAAEVLVCLALVVVLHKFGFGSYCVPVALVIFRS